MPFTVSEQQAYQSTFAEFREMIGVQAKSVDEVTPKVVEFYVDKLRKLPLAVDTHNRKIKRIRKVFSVLKEYYAHPNPFLAKTLLRSAREEQGKVPRRTAFSREEEQKLLQELDNPKRKLINKIEVRAVYHIGMFTGQLLKDCVLMQWQNIDMERKRIYVKQFKTGKEVSIPIAPELFVVLQEALKWKVDLYVCQKTAARYNQENEDGKNVRNNLVDIDVLLVIRWAGLEPSVKIPGRKKKVTVYGFHSLRHSFVSFCATAGVPKAVLLSILGTDSDIADKYYTHVGEEAQLQAISAISNSMSATTPQGRINSVLELLEHMDLQHQLVQQIRTMLAN